MRKTLTISAAICCLAAMPALSADLPEVVIPSPGNPIVIERISDNGEWGVSQSGSVTDGDLRPIGGVLFNLKSMEQTNITHPSGLSGVADVTDDGNIVVGECNGKPAYWNRTSQAWTTLNTPNGYDTGRLNAVTPDGKFAVGVGYNSRDEYLATPVVYNLSTNSIITLTNLPEFDMNGDATGQNAGYEITPDGRYIVCQMSQSYLHPVAMFVYVYDVQNQTYKVVGFDENPNGVWPAHVQYTHFLDRPAMSPNGKYLTGFAYMVMPNPASEWPIEGYHPYVYDMEAEKITVYSEMEAADYGGFSVLNDGTAIAGTPAENPYVTTMVRAGNYFVSLDQIMKQIYGIDILEASGMPVSGKCLSVSADGLTMVMLATMNDTYILRLPEPISEAAKRVNLLAEYTVTPTDGAIMSMLRSFTLTFDRTIKFTGRSRDIKFASEDGTESYNPLTSGGVTVDGKKMTVTFRTRDLTDGRKYTLTIPEGSIVMEGDAQMKAPAMEFTYTGRANSPVQLVEAYPADDATIPKLDLTESPILLTFDTPVITTENAKAFLYNINEGEELICPLNVLTKDNQVLAYPTQGVYLYKDSEYKVVIEPNSLTDVSGGCANEQIVILYHGNYTRQIQQTDKYLLNETCDGYSNFMLYEGDHLTPDPLVAQWGLTADSTPWYIVCDEDIYDMAFASTSMYIGGGKADNWMVSGQIKVPDENCSLEFDGQSFLFDAEDTLRVYIYTSDRSLGTLTKDIIDDILANGDLVFEEVLDPGKEENTLAGDWQHFALSLAKYAGKNIYIAFADLNDDQSCLFVDNIRVIHEMAFITSFTNPMRVVDQSQATIEGNISFASEAETFTSVDLTLQDAEGNTLDNISQSGLSLTKGSVYNFKFQKPLPLTVGELNPFTVVVKLDETTTEVDGSIADLAFKPTQHITLEKYTGAECVNCPMGIRAIENIQALYPGVLIPIAIHTYQNDPLGSGMGGYSQFLGLDQMGAPSATINRTGGAYPMINEQGDYRFSGAGIFNEATGTDEMVWLDIFQKELAQAPDMDVQLISKQEPNEDVVKVEAQVRPALNLSGISYNIFGVVVENRVETYQRNGFGSILDEDLGEWGSGGKYGSSMVYPYSANDVSRSLWGNTIAGTGGLIPANVTANETYRADLELELPQTIVNRDNCQVVVMVINSVTGRVVNSNIVGLNGKTEEAGVEGITSADTSAITFSVADGHLNVNGRGTLNVNAYDMAGTAIAAADGENSLTLDLGNYQGVLIVRAADEAGNLQTAKLIIR